MSLELHLWREISRHLNLSDSLPHIAPHLAGEIQLSLLAIRRWDAQRHELDTLAVVRSDGAVPSERRSADEASTDAGVGHLLPSDVTSLERTGRSFLVLAPGSRLARLLAPTEPDATVAVTSLKASQPTFAVVALADTDDVNRRLQDLHTLQNCIEPLEVAVENDRLVDELARLRETAEADARSLRSRMQRGTLDETIVGASRGLRAVMERIDRVAPTDAPVLLLGETGSGKEVIARALHERSRRRNGPFVRVNCGAIPPELVDSVLFGHEKGAFTGATSSHRGWFERADGGTLFLDEVAELSPAAQVRLLRVLQDGTLERVGGQRSLSVDVRIVAATHRDVTDMVASGQFRADLWYRLSVFPLRLPALRERTDDIPELVRHFAALAAERLGAPTPEPTAADIQRLVHYPWPGNVRELAAVIERATILGHGRQLDVEGALGAVARPALMAPPGPEPMSADREANPGTVTRLEDAMVRHIERALEETGGRIEGPYGAAALLHVNPHTLRSRMRKLGIDWSRFREGDVQSGCIG